jgi:ubiquinone/menaquinone biosynthesis C-methylase UbiE
LNICEQPDRGVAVAGDLSNSWKQANFDAQWAIAEPQLEKLKRGETVDVFESFMAIMNYIPNSKRYSFLDCACALGYYYDVMTIRGTHQIDYTGTDFSETAVERARARHPSVQWGIEDLTALSFPDSAYDIVMASGVLEHVPAWELALMNITRVAGEYVILHRLPVSPTGSFKPGISKQYDIMTTRNSFAFHQIVSLMASRDFFIINSLDTYGTYRLPEQTMLFSRMRWR